MDGHPVYAELKFAVVHVARVSKRWCEALSPLVVLLGPHEIEPHLETTEPLTRSEQLHRVLARSEADLSATETLNQEVDRHASLATLLDGYDVLAREVQVERVVTYLDVAPFPGAAADAVIEYFTGLSKMMRASLAWGQGTEMARHVRVTMAADMPVYFANPR